MGCFGLVLLLQGSSNLSGAVEEKPVADGSFKSLRSSYRGQAAGALGRDQPVELGREIL